MKDARAGEKNVGGCSWPGGTAAAGVAIGLRTLDDLFRRARNEILERGFEDEGAGCGVYQAREARTLEESARARARARAHAASAPAHPQVGCYTVSTWAQSITRLNSCVFVLEVCRRRAKAAWPLAKRNAPGPLRLPHSTIT